MSGSYGAEASIKQGMTKFESKKCLQVRKIGKMERDTEMVIEEAVIGCQFCPIYTLIKSPYLQECLKCCTDKYGCKEGGPYLITFGNDLDEPIDILQWITRIQIISQLPLNCKMLRHSW